MKNLEIGLEKGRIEKINYLKGFSIFTIVLMHLIATVPLMPNIIVRLSPIGGGGVHVFFLCSGIGLYLSQKRNPIKFKDFIKRRFLKIYLPYIIIVLISSLFPWMYIGKYRFLALLSHIFLFKMFFPQFEESFGYQFWFISTIFQLYLLFIPLFRIKIKLTNKKFILITLIISVIWWFFAALTGQTDNRVISSFCLQYLWEFSLGFVIGDYFLENEKIELNAVWLGLAAVIGISLTALLAKQSNYLKSFNDIPSLIGYLSLALLFSKSKIINNLFLKLSFFSYELYLIHILVFITVFHFVHINSFIIQLLIAGISLVVAIILSYLYNSIIKQKIFGWICMIKRH